MKKLIETPSDLKFQAEVQASINDVWQAWATREGILSFFAPDCRIELVPGGAYEMYFNLDAATGDRGGEECRLLAIEEPLMLSFTWNAPTEFPNVRRQKTHVTVRLEQMSIRETRVTLLHDGWGTGEEWQAAQAYFERAWGQVVLPRLQKRFTDGPIHWDELD
jgi:uncharacterized protein YndB with AHSA1/START domain